MYYKKSEDDFILMNDLISVSFTSEDTEGYYQQYLVWVAEGNTPEEWKMEL